MIKLRTIFSVTLTSLFIVSSTQAGLIVFGTGVLGGLDNVTGWTVDSPTTAIGFLGANPMISVSTDTNPSAPAAGQARIEKTDTPFSTVSFAPLNVPGFSAFEFNVNRIWGSGGSFDLMVTDNDNKEFSFAFTLGPGQNRVWAQGINGAFIKSITINASGALINDVRQVRVSAIPEPTALLLVGSIIGLGAFRRRR